MLSPLLCAIGFLTRIWVPTVELNERELGRSTGWFAWVGVLLAGLLWVVARALTPFDARLAALLVVAVWRTQGGLHLDGVADAIDGLSGGRAGRAHARDHARQPHRLARRARSVAAGLAEVERSRAAVRAR